MCQNISGLESCLESLCHFLVAGLAEEGEHVLLVSLNTWLVEWVHAENVTDDPAYFLVSNGIQEIRENGFGRENVPAMMAAVVVISVPLIVLFLVFRNKVMAGVSRGGIKG